MHKIIDGEIYFWLTVRAVDEADPFNGMWHYTGTVDRYGDYLVGGICRVLDRELGGATLLTCRRVGTIYPISSRRADILSILFLCTIDGEPSSTEQGSCFRRLKRSASCPSARDRMKSSRPILWIGVMYPDAWPIVLLHSHRAVVARCAS